MDFIDLYLVPCAFTVASAVLWVFAHRSDSSVRLPLGVYAGTYLITTGIGGVAIGCTQGEVLEWMAWDINLNLLPDVNSFKYWGLLFAPLIIPPACIICFRSSHERIRASKRPTFNVNESVSPAALIGTFFLFGGYCLTMLIVRGQALNILLWSSLKGDYLSMIVQREVVSQSVGSAFFGIAYIALPTLSFVAVYQYYRQGTLSWRYTFMLVVSGTLFIDLELMQKAPSLLFLLFLGLALIELKVLRLRALAYIFGGLVGTLTVLQSMMYQEWGWWQSIQLMVFRMAHGFPCYVNVYPEVLPFGGIETGLHLVGLGEPARDSFNVFDSMFPNVTWVQGALAAPAHMRAYSQAGVPYAIITLIIVGLIIKGIGAMRHRISGPISFALFMQALVFLYNLSQTSLRESVISCYGIFWAFIAIFPLLMLGDQKRARHHTVLTSSVPTAKLSLKGRSRIKLDSCRPTPYW